MRGGNGPGGYYYVTMLQFLLVFPFVYLLSRANRFSVPLFFFLHAALDLLYAGCDPQGGEGYGYWIFRHLFSIAFGCALALHQTDYKVGWYIASWVIGITYIVTQYISETPMWFIPGWHPTSYLAVLYLVPIFALLYKKCQNLRCPPLEALGRASYDIYLVQKVFFCWDIGQYISRRTPRVLVSVAICLVLGLLFHQIEVPICRFCQKQADRLLDKLDKVDWQAVFLKKQTENAPQ